MINTNQLNTTVRNINSTVTGYRNFNSNDKNVCRRSNAFSVMDSSLTGIATLGSLNTKDAALVFVQKGELAVIHNSKKYILSNGMLLVKTPDTILQLHACSKDCHFKIIAFTPQFGIASGIPIKHLEAIALMAAGNPVLILDTLKAATVDVLISLIQQKEMANEKLELYGETIKHVFSLLILEIVSLIKCNINDNTASFNRKAHLSFQFLKLLREHIKEERSVNFYAGKLYVTPKHLSMCVKETTGKTCGEIIDEMVVDEAKALLQDPGLTIGHVADELHFSDQYFFSKYFKKRTGLSPMNYRMAV